VVHSDGAEFVLADIPGLIEGAHEGAGLGARFLGHIERCGVLLHLVDGTGDDLAGAYRTVRAELEAYGADLAGKAEIPVLNKIDALDDELVEAQAAELAAAAGCQPGEIMRISGATGAGVPELLRALAVRIAAWREAQGLSPAAKGSAEAQPWEATQ
jgi:GTP-binding protein